MVSAIRNSLLVMSFITCFNYVTYGAIQDIETDFKQVAICMEQAGSPEDCKGELQAFYADYKDLSTQQFEEYLSELAAIGFKQLGPDYCISFAKSIVDDMNHLQPRIQVLEKLGLSYTLKNNFDSSAFYLNQGLVLAKDAKYFEDEMNILLRIASNHRAKQDYKESEKVYLEVLSKSTSNKYLRGQAAAYNGLGRLFGMLSFDEKSVNYFAKASMVYAELKDTMASITTQINQANGLINLDQLSMAEKLLLNAREVLSRRKDVYVQIGCLGQLARLYALQNEEKRAETIYREAISLAQDAGITSQEAYYTVKLAQCLLRLKQWTESEENAYKALAIYKSAGANDEMKEVYQTLYTIYEKTANYEKALYYNRKFNTLNDSLTSMSVKEQMLEMEDQYKDELAQEELLRIEQNHRHSTQKNIAFIILLLLLILLAAVFINRQRLKAKAVRIINLEKERSMKAELVNAELLNEKMADDLAKGRKELVSKALYIAEKNTMIDQLKLKLDQAPAKDNALLKSLKRDIRIAAAQEKEWHGFLDAFEQLHVDYLEGLKRANPKLTSNDLRLCALIKMSLDNKQIAGILHISDEGVKKARYRLKKKLELTENESLNSFIVGSEFKQDLRRV